MQASADRKTVIVVRQTRLDDLVGRFNTVQQAKFYVEHLGEDFSDYLDEHERYRSAMVTTEVALRDLGRVQRLERRYLPNFVFGEDDCVVVLGQDGLVANTFKYLAGQPVIGVNPDPQRWDGVLLPFGTADLARIVPEVWLGRRPVKQISMGIARLNTGLELHAVNDFFIGQRSHVSARYRIAVDDREERQSSSGIIVSTGLGSTGWLRSIYAGINGASRVILGLGAAAPPTGAFPWDADYLNYFVREPYPSRTTGAGIVIGRIRQNGRFHVVSEMPENGVIFSDGIEADYLEFNSGTRVEIGISPKQGRLVT
jgi:NAD kinase